MGETWIYHERQDGMLCGQHALNNLVQESVFTAGALAEIAHQLDLTELAYMAQNDEGGVRSKDYRKRLAEGSGNVDPSGNFSIEVLRSALLNRYDLALPNLRQDGVLSADTDVSDLSGFICNKESHWFAIRKIHGRYWNLNSTLERPVTISGFRVAMELEALQRDGHTVFCVSSTSTLPPPCREEERDRQQRGRPDCWWKEADLLSGRTTDATTGATDPWRHVRGTGMRLDGGARHNGHDMTEDDMLAAAIHASLQAPTATVAPSTTTTATAVVPPLRPEPAPTEPGAVRIKFRLPHGAKVVVRRFLDTESVAVLFRFVEETDPADATHRVLELRTGFPPHNMAGQKNVSIREAGLSGGAVVQGRYV